MTAVGQTTGVEASTAPEREWGPPVDGEAPPVYEEGDATGVADHGPYLDRPVQGVRMRDGNTDSSAGGHCVDGERQHGERHEGEETARGEHPP